MDLGNHAAFTTLTETDLERIPPEVRTLLRLPDPGLWSGEVRHSPILKLFFLSYRFQADEALSKALFHMVDAFPDRRRERDEATIDRLIDFYLDTAGRSPAEEQLLRENAELRARFLREVPCLTAAEVGRNAHSRSSNPSEPASRWKRERRVFAVTRGKSDLFPAFQFGEAGRPRPVIHAVLEVLPPEMTAWQTAFWFTSGNGWLDGAAPMERLEDREAVLAAAGALADPAVG